MPRLAEKAQDSVSQRLASLKHYPVVADDMDVHFDNMLLAAVIDVDLDSVPGHCSLTRLGTVNRQVFGVTECGYDADRLRLVRAEVYNRLRAVSRGVPVSDPLKVFVKQEPHKVEKLEQGRLRLIMSVSLIDSLVDRLLFMRLAYRVVRNYHKTNIMVGWTPVMGGYRHLGMMFPGKTISIDKKAWDWSVPRWLLERVMYVILDLCPDAPEWWRTAVVTRFACLFDEPQFIFPDGALGTQERPGVMKSGCYLTIIINSIAQLLLHEMAVHGLELGDAADPIIVLGDDSLQRWFARWKEYVKFLQKLGFVVEVQEHEKECEFAGFTFNGNYKPAYVKKHLFQLEHLPINEREIASQTLQNYQHLYYFVPEMLDRIKQIARVLKMPEAVVAESRLRALALGGL